MTRPIWFAAVSTALLLPAVPLLAQSPACSGRAAVSVAAGLAQNDRVDLAASPIQFGGRGLDLSASADRSIGKTCISAAVRGGRRMLAPEGIAASTERLIDAGLQITALRPVYANDAGRSISLGAALTGNLALTRHAYADGHGSNFRLGVASLGPALRVRQPIGPGIAVFQLSAPLVSLVDHPYTSAAASEFPPRLRLVSIGAVRGADASASYEIPINRKLTFIAGYRAGLMRYDDSQPVRSLSQSLTFGFSTQLGPRR